MINICIYNKWTGIAAGAALQVVGPRRGEKLVCVPHFDAINQDIWLWHRRAKRKRIGNLLLLLHVEVVDVGRKRLDDSVIVNGLRDVAGGELVGRLDCNRGTRLVNVGCLNQMS